MATLVIHGTMTHRAAHSVKWWWDSWHPGGFLFALAQAMERAQGWQDVWSVAGRHVSEIEELAPKWSLWKGYSGQAWTHKGHFMWSGADMPAAREAGAEQLALHLNRIAELSAGKRIYLVGHSHGCNVIKMASAHPKLDSRIFIEKAVFLACPHFQGKTATGYVYHYRLNPRRFGKILNLFSVTDTVQHKLAHMITGPASAQWNTHIPATGFDQDPDPAAASIYESWPIPTLATGQAAHSALHGAVVGQLAGLWLGGIAWKAILAQNRNLLPVAKDDMGE